MQTVYTCIYTDYKGEGLMETRKVKGLSKRGKLIVSILRRLLIIISIIAVAYIMWNCRAVDTRGNYSETLGQVVCEVIANI